MLETWLTKRFNLQLPLISAPMGGAAYGHFAAEVSKNGALGMVAAGLSASSDHLREQTASLVGSGGAWGVGLLAWDVERRPELLETTEELAPPLVSVSYGNFAEPLNRLKSAGSVVTTQAGNLEEAYQAVEAGVDFLVVRGGEGGGHGRNDMATMPLLQEVLERVDIPVVAAGGIANARGLAAVLAAGAVGAWVGTAFLGCTETAWPEESKKKVVAAADGDTIYTRAFDVGMHLDWPPAFGGRALANSFSGVWHGREDELALARTTPEPEERPVWSGQAVSMVNDLTTVAEVIAEFGRAEELLRRW